MGHRTRVLTVHGICTKGAWQERVQEVLEPHFRCVSLKYDGYRWLGFLKVLFDPGALRRRTLDGLTRGYSRATYRGARPHHVIAHSFGTLLTTLALEENPQFQPLRLVFVGSVLPRLYPWNKLLELDPEKFVELRNEHGKKDIVVWLAGFAGKLKRDLGKSGRSGFEGDWTHQVPGPLRACPECGQTKDRGDPRIHNVPLEKYGHRRWFLTNDHAAELWLPALWGLIPGRYKRFRNLCLQFVERHGSGMIYEAQDALSEISTLKLGIRDKKGELLMFGTYVALGLHAYLEEALQREVSYDKIIEYLDVVITGTARAVAEALDERCKYEDGDLSADMELIRALEPRIAAVKAYSQATEKFLARAL